MANNLKQITTDRGEKHNLGAIEVAAVKAVEQGANTLSGANTFSAAVTATSTLQVQGTAHLATLGQISGSDIVDSTAALALDSTAFDQTLICPLDGAAKTVTLPPNTAAGDIGKQVVILQAKSLVASGVLTIKTGAGNVLCTNSYSIGTGVTKFRPIKATDNTITISGANTNSAWGAGSTAKFTVLAAGVYLGELVCTPLGAGSDAIAYTTT